MDVARYLPIGIEMYGMMPEYFIIHTVDAGRVGDSFDSIQAYADSHDGILPTTTFRFQETLSDFLPYIQRFSVVSLNKLRLQGYASEESITLD